LNPKQILVLQVRASSASQESFCYGRLMKAIGKLAEWSQWCVTIPLAVIDTQIYIYKVDGGRKKKKKHKKLGTKIGSQYSLYARWLIFTVVKISYE
jgi:hypothetical protein